MQWVDSPQRDDGTEAPSAIGVGERIRSRTRPKARVVHDRSRQRRVRLERRHQLPSCPGAGKATPIRNREERNDSAYWHPAGCVKAAFAGIRTTFNAPRPNGCHRCDDFRKTSVAWVGNKPC